MDSTQLLALLMQHKWMALTGVLIFFVVRLLKSDTKIPIDIPPRLRAPLALMLGAFAGAIEKFAGGSDNSWASWKVALLNGITAAVLAMVGHSLVIESARGGKEFSVPGLMIPGEPPGPGKPPSTPPAPKVPPTGLTMMLLGVAMMIYTASCALFSPANAPKTELTLLQIGCIIANAYLDSPELNQICNLVTVEQQSAAKDVASKHRAAVAKKLTAATCSPDAGVSDGGALDGAR